MSTPLLYTSCEAIRGCLGIDANDCPDRVMLDSNLALEIEIDLDVWLPTHATIFNAYGPASTADQRKQGSLLVLFCQWYGASLLARRPHLVLQVMADGKNRGERFDVDLLALAVSAAQWAAKYKQDLQGALDATVTRTQGFSLAAVSVPDLDPVTEVPD